MRIQKFNKFKDIKNNTINKIDDINEGILSDLWDNFTETFKNLKAKFGIHTWEQQIKILASNGELPGGVSISYPGHRLSDDILNGTEDIMVKEDAVPLEHPDNNIENINIGRLEKVIKAAYKFKLKTGKLTTVFLWGAPGIGKTDIVDQIADELDILMIVFHLSLIDSTDFKGLPFIVEEKIKDDNGKTKIRKRSSNALPLIFPTSNGDNGKGGILFLDEMNLAESFVLKAAMPLALSGKFDGFDLPSKWIIVSAGNRKPDVPDTDLEEIKGALGNRFMHINLVTTVKDWTSWAKNKPYVDKNLLSFLNSDIGKEWFHKLEGSDKQSSAWPSPRSWTQATYAIWIEGDETFNMSEEDQRFYYGSFVGREAAVEYFNYIELLKYMSEKEMEEVYKTGNAPKLPTRTDAKFAVMSAIVYKKTGKKMTPTEFKNLLHYIKTKLDDNFEIITPMLKMLKMAHIDKNKHVYYKSDEPYKALYDDFIKNWFGLYNDIKKEDDKGNI